MASQKKKKIKPVCIMDIFLFINVKFYSLLQWTDNYIIICLYIWKIIYLTYTSGNSCHINRWGWGFRFIIIAARDISEQLSSVRRLDAWRCIVLHRQGHGGLKNMLANCSYYDWCRVAFCLHKLVKMKSQNDLSLA